MTARSPGNLTPAVYVFSPDARFASRDLVQKLGLFGLLSKTLVDGETIKRLRFGRQKFATKVCDKSLRPFG